MAETFPDPDYNRESKGTWRWAKWVLSVGAIVALVVVVAQVTRDEAGDPLPPEHEPPEGGLAGGEYSEEQALEFAACMRGEGIDFPDPEVGEDGQVAMSPGPGVDTSGPAFQEASAACEAELNSSGGQTSGSSGGQAQGGGLTEEQMATFAACMRREGIDMPDPEVGEDGQATMSPGPGVDTNGSAFQEARAVCQAELGPTVGSPSGGGQG